MHFADRPVTIDGASRLYFQCLTKDARHHTKDSLKMMIPQAPFATILQSCNWLLIRTLTDFRSGE